MTTTLSLPPRRFPAGPLSRTELEAMSIQEIANIPVTNENVLQLAHYCDPINPRLIRSQIGSYAIAESDITNSELREYHFRNWPTQDYERIRNLANNYILPVTSGNARIYIPQVYWVDENTGKAVRSGPFSIRPKVNTFNAIDLHFVKQTSSPMRAEAMTRWQSMEHPHIEDQRVCLGTEESSYYELYKAGDLFGLAFLFERLIRTYNPGSPYRRFRQVFPNEARVRDRDSFPRNIFLCSSDGYATTEIVRDNIPETPLVPFSVSGISLNLLPEEVSQLSNVRRSRSYSFIIRMLSEDAPRLIAIEQGRASSSEDDDATIRFYKRILPGEASMTLEKRFFLSGLEISPGFNGSDSELTCFTTPIKSEHAYDLPVENPNETTQTTPADESQEAAEANGSTEDAQQANSVAS